MSTSDLDQIIWHTQELNLVRVQHAPCCATKTCKINITKFTVCTATRSVGVEYDVPAQDVGSVQQ